MEEKGQRQQQRQTAKEVIAANVQHLIEQLDQGTERSADSLPHRHEPLSHILFPTLITT